MSGERKLIVNADGYGFGAGATQGITEAIREGRFVSSVSVNANFPDALRVAELASEFPEISIGVHLNPLAGRPCLPAARVSSLVDADGCFHATDFLPRLRRGAIRLEELAAEFDAQVGRISDLVGERLTHLDSQAHSHLHYFDLFLAVAQRWKLKRVRTNASVICLESPHPSIGATVGILATAPRLGYASLSSDADESRETARIAAGRRTRHGRIRRPAGTRHIATTGLGSAETFRRGLTKCIVTPRIRMLPSADGRTIARNGPGNWISCVEATSESWPVKPAWSWSTSTRSEKHGRQ